MGSLVLFLIFIISHIKVFLIWKHQTLIAFIAYATSTILFSLSYFVSNTVISVGPFQQFTEDQNLYWQCFTILSSPQIWFLILLATVFALIPDLIIKCTEDMQLSKHINAKQKILNYTKRSRTAASNKITLEHINGGLSDKPGSVLNVKLFQTERSVLSSHNIQLNNQSQESSF